MKVIMVGVGLKQKGGMLTVVENYLHNEKFVEECNLVYFESTAIKKGPKLILLNLKQIFRFYLLMRKEKYDIVHIHTSERLSIFRKAVYQMIAKKYGAKTILHIHGANIETWYESINPLLKSLVRKIFEKADVIIVLGNTWKTFFEKLVSDKKKIITVFNAVPKFEKNNYDINSTSFLFLGTINKRKGVPDLIKAIDKIDEALPNNIVFDFYGRDEESIFNNFDFRLHSKRIRFHGWVNLEDKQNLFSKTLCNILPSYNEGLPMTILETMSFGIPNISTDIAAIPEAIENGVDGFLVRPGNVYELQRAILEVVEDKQKLASISDMAFKKVNLKFSLEKNIAKIKNIYYMLIKDEI